MSAESHQGYQPTRAIEVAIEADLDTRIHDRAAVLIVWLAGVRAEMPYKHHSTAFAAAKRIAKAHRLVRRSGVWRSRP